MARATSKGEVRRVTEALNPRTRERSRGSRVRRAAFMGPSPRTRTTTSSTCPRAHAERKRRTASGRNRSASASRCLAYMSATTSSSRPRSIDSLCQVAPHRTCRTDSQFSTTSPAVKGLVFPSSRPTSSSSKSMRRIMTASAARLTRSSDMIRSNFRCISKVRHRWLGISETPCQGPDDVTACSPRSVIFPSNSSMSAITSRSTYTRRDDSEPPSPEAPTTRPRTLPCIGTNPAAT
mmetsp:Transcript_10508/g.33593  ORF Transcript_10508/g.33593 Transcript_10508/m.33593 type:complete len:236 (-) Transcript_10508:60-767(-)